MIDSNKSKGDLTASASAPTATVQIFQFCGLMWATEYNAQHARLDQGIDAQTVNGMNTLLMAYAALQALVLETALVMYPELYADKSGFRRASMVEQYERFLAKDGRSKESVPAVIMEIAAHRVALTHSEPDNKRSAVLGEVISATDAERFAAEVKSLAEWLWQGKRPGAVAVAYDKPNCFFNSEQG